MSKVWQILIYAPNDITAEVAELNRWIAVEADNRCELQFHDDVGLRHGDVKWLDWQAFAKLFTELPWQFPNQTQLFIRGVVSSLRNFDEMEDWFVEVARGNTNLVISKVVE